MKARTWAAGLLAFGSLFLTGGFARAADTIKLGLPARDDAPAMALGKISQQAETIDAHYRGGVRVGVYAGYGRGYYGYGRGYYGYGRGYYGYGYYPRYYGYGYYRPYVYSYYYPSTYYYPTPIYVPISTSARQTIVSADALNVPYRPEALPVPRPVLEEQTFPYDGGPRQPVPTPMPKVDPAPARVPTPLTVPPQDGRPVSLPAPSTTVPVKLTYPAYGELPRTTPFAQDRVVPVKK